MAKIKNLSSYQNRKFILITKPVLETYSIRLIKSKSVWLKYLCFSGIVYIMRVLQGISGKKRLACSITSYSTFFTSFSNQGTLSSQYLGVIFFV